jgi:hypothetical protein
MACTHYYESLRKQPVGTTISPMAHAESAGYDFASRWALAGPLKMMGTAARHAGASRALFQKKPGSLREEFSISTQYPAVSV